MLGVVNELPVPKELPPVDEEYQLYIPGPPVADKVTVPVPQQLPSVVIRAISSSMMVRLNTDWVEDKLALAILSISKIMVSLPSTAKSLIASKLIVPLVYPAAMKSCGWYCTFWIRWFPASATKIFSWLSTETLVGLFNWLAVEPEPYPPPRLFLNLFLQSLPRNLLDR